MAKAYKKRVLGRGLSAILNEDDNNRFKENINSNNINEIDVNDISLNPDQPRTNFNQNSLEQLASSINELGLIQPITVKEKDGKYILISGERRLRAFKKLNLDSIPAYIRKANDQSSLEMALVENIQRRDLDAIEIAISYKRLIEELNLSHDEMSKKLGKDRSTITNYIRLLKLDPIIIIEEPTSTIFNTSETDQDPLAETIPINNCCTTKSSGEAVCDLLVVSIK